MTIGTITSRGGITWTTGFGRWPINRSACLISSASHSLPSRRMSLSGSHCSISQAQPCAVRFRCRTDRAGSDSSVSFSASTSSWRCAVPGFLRLVDLSGQRLVLVGVAAVGEQGGPDALVDEVVGDRAFGPVVVVPGFVPRLDLGGVFIGQGQRLGAEAVLQGILAGPGFPFGGLRSSGFGAVAPADFAEFVDGRHDGSPRCWGWCGSIQDVSIRHYRGARPPRSANRRNPSKMMRIPAERGSRVARTACLSGSRSDTRPVGDRDRTVRPRPGRCLVRLRRPDRQAVRATRQGRVNDQSLSFPFLLPRLFAWSSSSPSCSCSLRLGLLGLGVVLGFVLVVVFVLVLVRLGLLGLGVVLGFVLVVVFVLVLVRLGLLGL